MELTCFVKQGFAVRALDERHVQRAIPCVADRRARNGGFGKSPHTRVYAGTPVPIPSAYSLCRAYIMYMGEQRGIRRMQELYCLLGRELCIK